jgi:hypothetical protein
VQKRDCFFLNSERIPYPRRLTLAANIHFSFAYSDLAAISSLLKKGFCTRHRERYKEFLLAKSQQKENFHVAAHLEMTTRKSFSTNC